MISLCHPPNPISCLRQLNKISVRFFVLLFIIFIEKKHRQAYYIKLEYYRYNITGKVLQPL